MGTDIEWIETTVLEAADTSPELFDQRDLDTMQTDPTFLSKFLRARPSKEDSLKMVLSTLRWRNEFQPRGGDEDQDASSVCFAHGTDHEGHVVVVVALSKISSESEDDEVQAERAIASTLEQESSKLPPNARICLLIDARQTRPAWFSLRVARFLITCLNTYYPCLVGPVLLYALPWDMRPTWAVMREELPKGCSAAVRNVAKRDVLETYIDPTHLVVLLRDPHAADGPPAHHHHNPHDVNHVNGHAAAAAASHLPSALRRSLETKSPDSGRRVTFAQTSPGPGELPQTHIAVLNPPKELVFSGDKVLAATLTVTNTSDGPIAFKIKTTSPTSYRVRPNNGVLAVGASTDVDLSRRSISPVHDPFRDKFLVMVTNVGGSDIDDGNVTDKSHEEVSDYFKTLMRGQISEFRLFTNYPGTGRVGSPLAAGARSAAARAAAANSAVSGGDVPTVESVQSSPVSATTSPSSRGNVATEFMSRVAHGAAVTARVAAAAATQQPFTNTGAADANTDTATTTTTSASAALVRAGWPGHAAAAFLLVLVGWLVGALVDTPAAQVRDAGGMGVIVLAVCVGVGVGVALDLVRVQWAAGRAVDRLKRD
eukprot:m.127831 g.127831  ORF g.127831 m.127831 type:complete len:598 (+) comp11218_c0_seq2:482-2275(+)